MSTKDDRESGGAASRRGPSECRPLLEAATSQLYRANAFRITGLAADTTTRDISRRTDQLKLMAELGDGESAHTGAYALKPPPALDLIRDAIQKLKDPERRIIDEFFWFWPEEFGSGGSDAALQALARGDSKTALRIWSDKEDDAVHGVIALHNLAVAYHLKALDLEGLAVGQAAGAERQQEAAHCWSEAFKRWERLAVDDQLWERVNARIRQMDDARLTTGFARRMRATLPQALDKINAELALAYAENGNMEMTRMHVEFMRASNQGLDDVEKTAQLILAPATTRLREQIQRAERRTEENPAEGASAVRELLEHAGQSMALFNVFFAKDHDTRTELFDEVASVCNKLQFAYHKKTDEDATCLELLRATLPFATSLEIRQRIEQNISILDGNVAYTSLEPTFALLKEIQQSKNEPRVRLDKFRHEAVPMLTSAAASLTQGTELHSQLFDSAAIVLRSLSLDAWNKHQDHATAVAAHGLAVKYACTQEIKKQLREDADALQHVALQRAAAKSSSDNGGWGCLALILGAMMLGAIQSCLSSRGSPPASKYTAPSTPTQTDFTPPNTPHSTRLSGQGTYRIPSHLTSELNRDRLAIESAKAAVTRMEAELAALERQVESERSQLDGKSQFAVQQFNQMVGRYNAKLDEVKAQNDRANQMVDDYNAKLRRYAR
jgi:hypothetical protein